MMQTLTNMVKSFDPLKGFANREGFYSLFQPNFDYELFIHSNKQSVIFGTCHSQIF